MCTSASRRVRGLVALACAGVGPLGVGVAYGTPYASQVSITGTTVTFNLNEAADSVKVLIGGAETPLLSTAGFQSFTIPSATTPFSIQVDKNSAAGWKAGQVLQVGTDTLQTTFTSVRGVGVNRNPGAYFGRAYVSNDTAGSNTSTAGVGPRTNGAGIYVLNADLTDAVAQVDTALDPVSGGAWGTVANTPWHVEVGPDNNVYVSDAGATAGSAGTLWRLNPDASAGSNALFGLSGNVAANATANGHGRIYGSAIVKVDGTGAVSVYATDGDLNNGSGFNAIQRYDLGVNPTGAPAAPVPVTLIANPTAAPNAGGINGVQGVTTDLAIGNTDGRFYFTENRSAGLQPGLFVVNPADGTILWDSLTETQRLVPGATVDALVQTRSVAVSPDNQYVAMISDDNKLRILPLTLSLNGVDGLPNLDQMIEITTAFPTNVAIGRDLDFDAAGNLYAVSSGQAMLRVFSPGGTSTYYTSFDGTNYSFGTTAPVTVVPGDADGDGDVDLDDQGIWASNFTGSLEPGTGTGTFGQGDFDGDKDVDLDDQGIWASNFTGSLAPSGLAGVPEPAGIGLIVCGVLGMTARRRRRG